MSYLILIVLILIVVIIWMDSDNREDFGSGSWFPNMTLMNSYMDVREYEPIDDGPLFPKRDTSDIEPSDQAVSSNYYDFMAPNYIA